MRVTSVFLFSETHWFPSTKCFVCGVEGDRGVIVNGYSESDLDNLVHGSYHMIGGLLRFIGICAEHENLAALLNMGGEGDVDMSDDVVSL